MAAERDDKASMVRRLFDEIAPGYDTANSVMSLGRDRRWRELVARSCRLEAGSSVLDVCCGTGELSLALAKSGPDIRVTGLDFSAEMLAKARTKTAAPGLQGRIDLIEADATRLPFADASFDAATVGWGLRNVPDLDTTLREMARVVKPGGWVVSIDMGHPRFPPVAWAYWGISRFFVPAVGKAVSDKASAYRYLHESAKAFIDQRELARRFAAAGLGRLRIRNFLGGAVAMVEGSKPGS
ncbi:MAG TPA: bifunctional demethylmenaquinone methyltransferase/2-methoxy-6-polyprenyl-1,4-benzoquinol methylase UbiE [Rectinemataceae bacterium]|nr:bifunctional demethylmenaquinone methyltransferase/2-methoxy-6-polyprenyl-1,4-benzoquinol methylase UbiE [Rectinemataceae bacterium]